MNGEAKPKRPVTAAGRVPGFLLMLAKQGGVERSDDEALRSILKKAEGPQG